MASISGCFAIVPCGSRIQFALDKKRTTIRNESSQRPESSIGITACQKKFDA